MIPSGFYIVDSSVKYLKARNPLEESLIYCGDNKWSRRWDFAHKYDTAEQAIENARILQKDSPVKVLHIQTNGNNIGVGEIQV